MSFFTRITNLFRGPSVAKNDGNTATLAPLLEVFMSFTDPVVVYDSNFAMLAVNRAAESFFDVSENELKGMRIDPGWVAKPHYRFFVQTLFPSLAPSIVEHSEPGTWPQIVSLTFENPRRNLVSTLYKIPSPDGGTTAFVKIVHDETREREILEARTEFVGVAAHQLRTPLTALRWSLEGMEKGMKPESEDAQTLHESLALVDRSLKIVNDFLDAAKIEEGKFGFSFESADLVKLLEELLAAAFSIAKRYDVAVYFNHEGIASLPVLVDPTRIATAFLNFIDNGIRYNIKGGRVTVTLSRNPAGDAAIVTIADTGIGIPKGEEHRLFQKLARGSNAAQVEPNGSGLGLYIAKNIIEGHRGSVTVASELNRGTTVTVTLPLRNTE